MNTAGEPICVLIAEDEAPMRTRLRSLLAEDQEVGRVIEAESGIQAVELATKERPDIIFLDVQMPGLDGFQVINAVGAENMPLTVFITAFDRFAVQAFEADALDYLLKPFGNRRYEAMMARAKKRLREQRAGLSRDAQPFGPELLKRAADRSQRDLGSELGDEIHKRAQCNSGLRVVERHIGRRDVSATESPTSTGPEPAVLRENRQEEAVRDLDSLVG